ncbi:tetratricopeptide repeat protein [Gracilimonas aurantiaca]|uniref:tetratricopeptide repeat protein n=1 Tax=Gracilimonas aurantiaca TaxID=3234185 RepID=UPI003466D365
MLKIIKRHIIPVLLLVPLSLNAQVQEQDEIEGKSAYIQGLEAFEFGELQLAESLLMEAYKHLGDEAGINFALADLYFQLEDLPNAALYGKRAAAIEEDNKWYRLKLANIYRSAGQNQATIDELNTILNYHPNDLDALYMLAETHRDYSEFIKSNNTLDRILEVTGPNVPAYLLKFRNYESIGIADSAIVQLEKIREIDPDNLNTLNLLGEFYALLKRYDEAKAVFNEALERNARDPQTLINLGALYIDETKWDSAGTLLGDFVSDPLNDAEEKLRIAQFLYTRVENAPDNIQLRVETERIFDLLTESENEFGPAYSLAGQFYIQNQQFDKALDRLKTATSLLPQDDIAWRQYIQVLLSQEEYEEAISVGIKANEQVPEDAFIQFFTGSAYMLNDQNEEAKEWLEMASRAPARRAFKSVIYSALGDVLANLEEHPESDRAYELAIRYDENNDNALNNYAYNLSLRGEKLEKAKEMALKAVETVPENSAYLDTAGWVYYRLGDYDRARRYIKASIDTGNASAEVYEHLGDVYEKLGNMNEARKWWKQALEADSTRSYLQSKIG